MRVPYVLALCVAAQRAAAQQTCWTGGDEKLPGEGERAVQCDIIADWCSYARAFGEEAAWELFPEGRCQGSRAGSGLVVGSRGAVKYNSWTWRQYYWDERFHIPYEIDPNSFLFSEQNKQAIDEALASFSSRVGVVELEPYDPDVHGENGQRILFTDDGGGCASYVGRTSYTEQRVWLAYSGCLQPYIIHHEVMHAIGFFHEQSRPDRDEHIVVNLENVRDGAEHNFAMRESAIDSLGIPYDTKSVMHYSSGAFSSNGEMTITTIDGKRIEYNTEMSDADVTQIMLLYQCQTGPRTNGEFLSQPCTDDCPCTHLPTTAHDVMVDAVKACSNSQCIDYGNKVKQAYYEQCSCNKGKKKCRRKCNRKGTALARRIGVLGRACKKDFEKNSRVSRCRSAVQKILELGGTV